MRCPACKQPVEVPTIERVAETQASKSALLRRQREKSAQRRQAAEPTAPPVAPPPVPPPRSAPTAQPPKQTPPVQPPSESGIAPPLAHSEPAIASPAHEPSAESQTVQSESGVASASSSPGTTPGEGSQRALHREQGYRVEKSRRETVYLLAAGIAALACFSLAPAVAHWRLASAPGWAQAIVLVAFLQFAYAVWLAISPDWSSVWVAMFALAGVAALYATALAISLHAKPNEETILDLAELLRTQNSKPTLWCGAVVLLTSLLAYLCGLVSHRWHKAYRLYVGR